MKGYLYYSKEGSTKNKLFIDDLIKHAKKRDIALQLILDDEKPGDDADFIIFRDRNPELARRFEMLGIPMFNRSEVNRVANSKLKTYEIATLLGVPAVPTKKIHSVKDIRTYPIVLKTIDGHAGSEVYLCPNAEKASKIMKKFEGREIIAQPYVESGTQDVRVFVLGQEVVGAVKRTGKDTFKSNYSLGGSIEQYVLTPWQIKDAQTIARGLKSDYIGVDFLLLQDGRWLLNEIEDPVGARSLYLTHGFSIAEKLMAYVQETVELSYV